MATNIYNSDLKGICSVRFYLVDGCLERVEFLSKWGQASKRGLAPNSRNKKIDEWVASYIAGKPRKFPYPIKPEGTKFQKKVWSALLKIPFGEIRTYGEIAPEISHPSAVRAVGSACGKNPIPLVIPCHRVVGAKGIGGFSLGLSLKKKLLMHEDAIKP